MLLLALLLLLASPARAADRWRWPLRGEVLTPFHLATSPFAPGQHRGIDIAAPAGERVRSACPGRVAFAGRVPGRGRAVTVLCGALVATYLELGETLVRKGAPVAAGELLGTVAASHLQLGARRAGDRHGYVDPLTLLRPASPPPGVAPPGRRAPRRAPPRPARGRAPARAPAPRATPVRALRVPSPVARGGGVPVAAWLGLGLLAGGTPLGAVWRRRRRARLEPAAASR